MSREDRDEIVSTTRTDYEQIVEELLEKGVKSKFPDVDFLQCDIFEHKINIERYLYALSQLLFEKKIYTISKDMILAIKETYCVPPELYDVYDQSMDRIKQSAIEHIENKRIEIQIKKEEKRKEKKRQRRDIIIQIAGIIIGAFVALLVATPMWLKIWS